MSLETIIRRYLSIALLVFAAIVGIASMLVHASPLDTDDMSGHVSRRTQRRMDQLDSYAERLMTENPSGGSWTELQGFPEDMVLYKYLGDTLNSWYNLFSISNDDLSSRSVVQTIGDPRLNLSSPLAQIGETASFVNLGPNWYLVKSHTEGDIRVIEGLLVKSDIGVNVSKGINGVNPFIHVHGKYTVTPLSEGEGSPIFVDNHPVFKIAAAQTDITTSPQFSGVILRFLALTLLCAALLVYLIFHRSIRNMLLFAASVTAFAFISRSWGTQLSDFYQMFSPILYAHDGLLNSFGALLFFDQSIFFGIFGAFLCRDCIFDASKRSKRISTVLRIILPVILAVLIYYIYYTLSSLILNSSISLEIYRFNALSLYTALVFLYFGLLFISVLMLLQITFAVFGSNTNLFRPRYIFIFALIAASFFGLRSAQLGFVREQSRVRGWSNRLAVDRDLEMELQLRHLENDVAADPILYTLTHMNGAEKLLLRRLDEMYFRTISSEFDINVKVSKAAPLEFGRQMEALISDGKPIGPRSHFFYNYNSSTGSRYTGIFQYPDAREGLASLIVEITPKVGNLRQILSPSVGAGRVNLPPNYSYARYSDNHLVAFSGSFAYPTVLDGIQHGARSTFEQHGYRHFLNHINDDETIIITRRERSAISYAVSFSYLVLLIFLLGMLFRRRDSRIDVTNGYFSTRMRRLVVLSLIITLVLMAGVSILFVYQRNQRNLENLMSEKISTLQIMLGGACRQMQSSYDMRTPEFVAALEEITSTTSLDINLYTPDGRLFMSSTSDSRERLMAAYRIDPEAFKALCLGHQRYYIDRRRIMGRPVHVMYAPVFNAQGSIIAVAHSTFSGRDYDFTFDVVFHAATLVSLFVILLLVTSVLFSSITASIFRPLLAMGRKMKSESPENLEKIEYDGDDEISSLVGAYNEMVDDLRESTIKLTAAERDKAWSEMARQVAHEIKNPLTPIKLEIQRIQRLKLKGDPSWQEKFDKMSEVVLEHIDILSQTASEFSTFAKLYSENPVEIDLDKTLRDQIMLFSSEEKVEITYLGAADALISGPKPQLIRVFVNLLTNAVQAVDGVDTPKVVVSLRRADVAGWWNIVFEDNGPGVSEENSDKLFTPNFTTKSSGTGLGLAISRNIVERCGGTIKYGRSFSLGGACFTVSLPSKQTI